MSGVTTILSYEGKDYIIDQKPVTNLILYIGESPKPQDVGTYIHDLYGANIKVVQNEDNRIHHPVINQGEGLQTLDIQFVKREEEPLNLMPALKPLEKSDQELKELLEKNQGKLTDDYKRQLIDRAERVLNTCFEKKIENRVPLLLRELDAYRQMCRDFKPKARQRISHQVALEDVLNQIVQENNLNM